MSSGILMGFVSLFVRGLSSIPTFAIVSLRGLFAFLFLFLFLVFTKRLKNLFQLIREFPVLIVFQGLASAFTIYFYFNAILLINPGIAAFLLYTGPIFAVIFMWGGLKRKPSPKDGWGFAIALIGIAFLTKPWQINSDLSWIGLGSGLLSGVCLGIFNLIKAIVFQKWSEKNQNSPKKESEFFSMNITIATCTTLMIFLVFATSSIQYYPILNSSQWIIATGLGLIPTAIAFVLMNIGLQQDHAGDVLIFSYSETIVGSIITAILYHSLGWELIIGGVIIICANIFIAIQPRKKLDLSI